MQTADKDRLKAFLPQYLAQRGIETSRAFHCLNPAHPDRNPSMRYDPRREAVHCFSCGADYDLFELIGIEYGLDSFMDQLEKTASLTNDVSIGSMRKPKIVRSNTTKPTDLHTDTIAYLATCHAHATETNYFAQRGVSTKIVEKFRLGYDPFYREGISGQPWQAVVIPTGNASYTARNINPTADSKHRIRKHGESAFLGWTEALSKIKVNNAGNTSTGTGNQVMVVEGEFDALSLWEIGEAAISLGSVANINRFRQQLEENFPQGKDTPTFLLAMDTDEAGRKASAELLEALSEAGFSAYEVDITGSCKDPNEALMRDRMAFQAAIAEARQTELRHKEIAKKAYQSNSSAAHLSDFIGNIAASVNTTALPTGFTTLDVELDGGLYEGLYIFGAISSLGKTSLLLQIADQLADSGQDVMIFSLEMARAELMAKSISRHTLGICIEERIDIGVAKTARGITSGKRYQSYSDLENNIIQRSIETYGRYAEHLFMQEGIGDIGSEHIRKAVKQHIEITGNHPVVLVDYLQILAPYNERASDKQNTDRAVLELKRISRDFKIPVLGISSFNRAGYGAAVTMESFKESGAIEYSSDVLIGLQLAGAGTSEFDVNAAKQENPRKVELVILKNRNGATGGRIRYKYYPLFNAFLEDGPARI